MDAISKESKEAVLAKYPNLIPANEKLGGFVLAAKNIRIELKAAFPGVKFSVRSKSFSMGNEVIVKWTDGPTEKEVEAIAGKYEKGSFNGMEDIYEYNVTTFNEVFGGTKYLLTTRNYSESFMEDSAAKLGTKLPPVNYSDDAYLAIVRKASETSLCESGATEDEAAPAPVAEDEFSLPVTQEEIDFVSFFLKKK